MENTPSLKASRRPVSFSSACVVWALDVKLALLRRGTMRRSPPAGLRLSQEHSIA
jgi:hypothetical protein